MAHTARHAIPILRATAGRSECVQLGATGAFGRPAYSCTCVQYVSRQYVMTPRAPAVYRISIVAALKALAATPAGKRLRVAPEHILLQAAKNLKQVVVTIVHIDDVLLPTM